jgi:hypothetical protein
MVFNNVKEYTQYLFLTPLTHKKPKTLCIYYVLFGRMIAYSWKQAWRYSSLTSCIDAYFPSASGLAPACSLQERKMFTAQGRVPQLYEKADLPSRFHHLLEDGLVSVNVLWAANNRNPFSV